MCRQKGGHSEARRLRGVSTVSNQGTSVGDCVTTTSRTMVLCQRRTRERCVRWRASRTSRTGTEHSELTLRGHPWHRLLCPQQACAPHPFLLAFSTFVSYMLRPHSQSQTCTAHPFHFFTENAGHADVCVDAQHNLVRSFDPTTYPIHSLALRYTRQFDRWSRGRTAPPLPCHTSLTFTNSISSLALDCTLWARDRWSR
jgi:hypothetical protein